MEKREIIEVLEKIRKFKVCCYQGNKCDCKYRGLTDYGYAGEKTGCPEMRDIITLLTIIPSYVFIRARAELEEKKFKLKE